MRFPWAQVASISGLLDSPQLAERDFFVEIECAHSREKIRCPGAPFKTSRSPWRIGRSAASCGEHNVSVYQDELGLTGGEIEQLTSNEVI